MKRLLALWKASVTIKVVAACAVVIVVVFVGRCVAPPPPPAQVLVRGARVTPMPVPNTPTGVVVVSQETEFGGPQLGGLNALRGVVSFVPEGTSHVLDGALSPVALLYTTKLDIPARSWRSGFPGVPGGRFEWFQVVYEGAFVTAQGGAHQFEIVSDDGAKLFIDDQLVVENDGRHPPKSARGAAALTPGPHRIRVAYFQGPRFEIALQLFVTTPASARQILDVSYVL